MRNDTRRLFNAYVEQLAKLNGVDSATAQFTVEPSVQQKLETKIQESSEFLGRINIVGVPEQAGDKLGLGISAPVASTTNTTLADRATRDLTTLDEQGYFCTQTNFDTHLTYAKIDMWAKFPDFQTRIRDVILRRQALDRIMIGFNGTSRAATSNPTTNPLLQDVNIGWLQKYRTHAAARVMAEVVAASGKVTVGAGAGKDYKNLDALVFDAVSNLIDPWYREDTALVAVMGRRLLDDKYFPIINTTQPPSETLAADVIISQKRVGGLPAVRVPFVPDGAILITRLDNLSIYWQEGTRRRKIDDNAKRDRIENYESSNEAYVVEDYGCGCLVENIEVAA
ncbi:phage major capsid protein, P2 family [Thauera butanivorans]|uniref:phage major capsid protein, P2 family n=1 Tax=Thauera butanivorans TaxID=86174 RepID=UPI00083814B9|nr:phage major capsid protein, P2 family [Thauera butanivorans]